MNLRKTLRYLYFRFVRLHGKPHEVAMGVAIGLGVGMTPTMGVQMPIAIAIAAIFRQSKIAAAAGVWITNPVTAPLVYFITYALGAFFLGYPLRPPEGFRHSISHMQGLTSNLLLPLVVGGFVAAIPMAVTGYWFTYQAVVAYRLKVKHRRANRRHRWKWNPHQGWHRVSAHGHGRERDGEREAQGD
ncbi:MAG: DUF2062 domain-containing protein [Deferrisomatales bacterium]|nr:DUF2062 domain-containing protein [Deferrisomatales bacterium]